MLFATAVLCRGTSLREVVPLLKRVEQGRSYILFMADILWWGFAFFKAASASVEFKIWPLGLLLSAFVFFQLYSVLSRTTSEALLVERGCLSSNDSLQSVASHVRHVYCTSCYD